MNLSKNSYRSGPQIEEASKKQFQQPPAPKVSPAGYNVLAYLKNNPALLSIYDALQMWQELRESQIETLSNPNIIETLGPLDRIARLATISFTYGERYAKVRATINPSISQGLFGISSFRE